MDNQDEIVDRLVGQLVEELLPPLLEPPEKLEPALEVDELDFDPPSEPLADFEPLPAAGALLDDESPDFESPLAAFSLGLSGALATVPSPLPERESVR